MDDLHRTMTIWLVIINTIAIAVYGWDKFCAKQGWRRVPEKSLLLLAAIGGSIGAMGAMALFHPLKKRVVNIDHQLQRASDMRLIITPTKTNAGTRRIPITEDVAECFQAIIEDRETPQREAVIDGYSGFLFLDKDGLPLVSMHWEHRFNHMVNRYNGIFRLQLPNITPHVCRHTYCSNMAKSGMNPKTLQYLMGHSDIGVTMNTYTHLGLEDAADELRKMEEERAREEISKSAQRRQETRLTPRMLRVV